MSYHIRVRSHTPNYHASTDAIAAGNHGSPRIMMVDPSHLMMAICIQKIVSQSNRGSPCGLGAWYIAPTKYPF